MAVGFYFDMQRCTGCRACQVACKDKNRLDVGTILRNAHTYCVGSFPEVKCYSVSQSCNHCEQAACLENCPAGAIYRAPDGTVIQDAAACIGCQTCVNVCPFGHPQFIESQGVAIKCDGCYAIRANGGQPACVAGCPNRALDFGEVDDLVAKYGPDCVSSIAVLPEADTLPNLLINAKPAALEADFTEVKW